MSEALLASAQDQFYEAERHLLTKLGPVAGLFESAETGG
jgi:hypothetical protein